MFDEQPDGNIHGECSAEIHTLQKQVGDLTIFVSRLVRLVRKLDGDCALADSALDYLREHNIKGDWLRETQERIETTMEKEIARLWGALADIADSSSLTATPVQMVRYLQRMARESITPNELTMERHKMNQYAHKTCPKFDDADAVLAWHRNEIDCLTHDAMTMALRLMGEDENSFAPETRKVMERWRVMAIAELSCAE